MDNDLFEQLDAQSRLYAYLRQHGAASTPDIRKHCGIGNPSQAASGLNARLERMGRTVRVVCERRPSFAFGKTGKIGVWRLHHVA